MKLLKNLLSSIKPHFEKDGKLENFYPAYDAFETFLFVPDHTTDKGTHIKDAIDLKRTMAFVVLAMLPCILFGMWNIGSQYYLALNVESTFFENLIFGFWKFLPLLIVSYAVGLTVEFAFAISRGHSVNEGYLVSGMLIPLIMPVDVPLWMLAVSVVFAVVIGKEVFGGTGMNILNPALTARAFLFFAYPSYMSGDKVWVHGASVDGYSGETILGALASNTSSWNSLLWNASDAFYGFIPGSVGETSFIAILIGAGILIFSGIGSWRIIVFTFLGGYLTALLFNLWGINTLMSTPAHIHLLIGGFAFGAVFMATDPVTATQTNKGKVIYGLLVGFFAIVIRIFNPAYPEGMMLAILFMNVFAPLIDHYIIESNIKRRLSRLKV
ncbi:NADH:ubiquinone reductase (Na(+)-transporting) subunit B [Flavobacteriales bacterium]|jgi:Na+-transporting NADH:ubiquinone oxidoreductase subunit B|nr:NADH:ubiquinone reductase (Na(+)-transporting) subunit B [Flavobacteriales bacterium]|tara:strand:- start:1412 stop:2560 length:1149 start_codon:yes stop_codon:yes gene_type:complete